MVSEKDKAWEMLCQRLGRDPAASEESDTCSLRAAWKAMIAFSSSTTRAPADLRSALEAETIERAIADAQEFASAARSDGFDAADALDLIEQFAALAPTKEPAA